MFNMVDQWKTLFCVISAKRENVMLEAEALKIGYFLG